MVARLEILNSDFAQEAGCIRNKRQYQECSTQKNGVFFTTSSLLSLRREFDQLSENYNRTQSGLVHEVVSVAGKIIRDTPKGYPSGSSEMGRLTTQLV